MKLSACAVSAFLALLLWVHSSTGQTDRAPPCMRPQHRVVHTVQIVGSRLPDCSHACGSCSPCKLVSVGSTCARARPNRAESCPISYRCMCRNKLYPVP
ncbi:hypothetical protein EUGRSUZ_F03339 [Eucalyptus grandis]|uniref:Uncharacterized protein n=2 Tax=Eucalyptus grandis TaxID=71139 RepID=A0ACC3KKX3_EUCGR|nr:hypothetical protein EUGRSUZ_F03339 [Eucalyptus grandis]